MLSMPKLEIRCCKCEHVFFHTGREVLLTHKASSDSMYSYFKADKDSISLLNQKPYFLFHILQKRNKEGRGTFNPRGEKPEVFSGFG